MSNRITSKPRRVASRSASRFAARGLVAAAFLLAAAAPLAGAYGAEPKRGGTLVLAREDEPLALNPYLISDNGSIWSIVQFCDSLLEPDATGYGLRPALAESWEISDDGLVYTFTLRDAKFSNGEPVTIEDVMFSLDKATDPEGYLGFVFPPMVREAVDSRTLRITLEEPFAPLLSTLSLFAAAIVDKETYLADEERFSVEPLCAGAFKVESFERGSKLVLTPNPYYWDRRADGGPAPYLDRIEMLYVPESNGRILGLRNGDYDVVAVVPLNQAKSIDADPDLTLEVAPAFRLDYVYLNHRKPPLDDARIRLAMNYAANRDAILSVAYFGFGEVPNSFMPVINYHCKSVEKIPFDLDKAKALVAEAGYDGTPIEVMVDTGNATFRQIATMLEQSWEAAGLNIEIAEYDVGTAYGKTETGDYQAYVSYITSDTNDNDFLATIEADHNVLESFFTGYVNEQVVEWLREARQTLDPDVRQDLYCKVQDQVYHDGYSVPLNFKPFVNAYRNDVMGWRNLVTGPWWLKDVWLDR